MFIDRTAIFIDGAYFDKLLELEFNRSRIDFGKFVKAVSGDHNVFRTYYYHCPPYVSQVPTEEETSRAEAKDRFFTALSSLPRFQVRLGKLVYRGQDERGKPIFVQKLVDIMLGVDLVLLGATRQITRAIIVAGDSDFVPAVEAAKMQGVLISLCHGPTRNGTAATHNTVHRELWDACDERFEMDREFVKSIRR